jgi:antirestriction protein ArdC
MATADRISQIARRVQQRGKQTRSDRTRAPGKKAAAVERKDWYGEVQTRFLDLLDRADDTPGGPFRALGHLGTRIPVNGATGAVYTGLLNQIMLSIALEAGETDPRFMTFKQAIDRGWNVRKGERSRAIVLFYKPWILRAKHGAEGEEETPQEKKIFLLRGHPVFHASQIDGIPAVSQEPIDVDAQLALREMGDALTAQTGLKFVVTPKARYAMWRPSDNTIYWNGRWDDLMSVSVLAHEMVHASSVATGRQLGDYENDTPTRAAEELVAEMGAATLRARLGLNDEVADAHSLAYLQVWRSLIRDDKRAVFRAMKEAGKSVEWLLSHAPSLKHVDQALAGDDSSGDFVFDLAEVVELAGREDQDTKLRELFGEDADAVLAEIQTLFGEAPGSGLAEEEVADFAVPAMRG